MTSRFGARALVVAAVLAVGATGLAAGQNVKRDGRLAFMVGCWKSEDGANREVWTAPVGGVMFGHATTMREGRLAFFEQARIDLRTQPAIYTVSPNGLRSASFLERAGSTTKGVTFENPQNEAPQLIFYRTDGRNKLAATVSQLDGSRATEYKWKKC
jgi:Domain of unknown function (DUF6265)